jgi:type I restriction enzyme S subunit
MRLDGWRLRHFGEIAEISFSGVDKKAVEGELPVRLCNYVDVFHNTHIDSSIDFSAATATAAEIQRFQLRRGDVVFTKDSETPDEIAVPAYVSEDLPGVVCGYHLGIARPREGVDGQFLFFAMQTHQAREQFSKAANGVTRFGLTLQSLGSIQLPVPPLTDQLRIADILSTWDRAIRSSKRNRDLVEQMYLGVSAREIHFRGSNMRPLGDVLSPDRMREVKPEGPFRALGIRSHGKGTFQRTDNLATLESEKTVYCVEPNRFIVNIVFAWEGAAAITSEDDAGCLVSHRFPTFSINESLLYPDYFRHVIRAKAFQQLLALASPGGAGRNKTLNRRDLLRFELHIPTLEKQKLAAAALVALDKRQRLLDRYIQCLTSQREGIAAELLTGRQGAAVEGAI